MFHSTLSPRWPWAIAVFPVTLAALFATYPETAQAAAGRPTSAPKVSSVAATSGPSTGGTRVTVKGTDLNHVLSVTVGGIKGKSLHVSTTHKSLTFTTPAHVIGRVDVRVKTSGGTSPVTTKDRFTYRQYTSVAGGDEHTCAVVSGAVHCWGYNFDGQLGNNDMTTSHTPVTVIGLSNAVAVAGGYRDSCALLSSGHVRCWGYNAAGELGNNTMVESHVPVTVSGLSHVVALTAGYLNTCAVIDDGTARCWGYNDNGQLGNNSVVGSSVPVVVRGLSHVTAIRVGRNFACATRSDGTVRCWGSNANGQLGNGTVSDSHLPVSGPGLRHVIALSAGGTHACAVTGGAVFCWGANDTGQLGNGTLTQSSHPTRVVGLTGVTAIASGMAHTCVLHARQVFCWGSDVSGQLGDGTIVNTPQRTPTAVAQLGAVREIALGDFHSCARTIHGVLRCWGGNDDGELGDGTVNASGLPVTVVG